MELKLLYPTDELVTVNVTHATIKLAKVLSNQNYWHDYSMGARTLACICGKDPKTQFEPFLKVSSLDGLRIARLCKKLSTGSSKYLPKSLKKESGAVAIVKFDLEKDVNPTDIYDKDLQFKEHVVRLKPETVKDQTFLLSQLAFKNNKEGVDDFIDCILESRIALVDSKPPKDDLPLSIVSWLQETVKPDLEKYTELSQAKDNDNDEEFVCEIGLYDQNFLLGD